MRRMDKSRSEIDRGEKARSAAAAGLDPATAALYAPWLHQEQALLSNMLGGAGGVNAYGAAAAAAAMGGGQGWYADPRNSSAAGLASLAAAQQQAQQAAALASLGPAAAAYQDRAALGEHYINLSSTTKIGHVSYIYYPNFISGGSWYQMAGLQQMEMLSRLQGAGSRLAAQANALAAAAAAGLGGYPGLHPEHLMNLEMLQAQHVMAAAALAASSKASSMSSKPKPINTSSSISSMSKTLSSLSDHRNSGAVTLTTAASSSRPSVHAVSSSSSRPLHSATSSLDISRLAAAAAAGHPHSQSSTGASRNSSNYHTPSPHRYSSPLSESSLRDSSPSLSYGIASLMADKHPSVSSASQQYKSSPSPHAAYTSSHARTNSHQAERVAEKLASNGSVSISKAIRNKELEIIPISPAGGGSLKDRSNSGSSARSGHHTQHSLSSHHRDKTQEPKVSISTVSNHARLPNGIPSSEGGRSSSWAREESASVSIEPCGPGDSSTRGDDAPLNLSMKSSTPTHRPGESKLLDKRLEKGKEQSLRESLLGHRGGLPPLIPGLGGSSGGAGAAGLTPSLEVLQSLYASQAATGEPAGDIMHSMQEALQRQLMGQAYDSKREDKKKRGERAYTYHTRQMEEAQERARHLGRGISKPKKNTVASLLEQCRAQGIKPQLPLPLSNSLTVSSPTFSPGPVLESLKEIGSVVVRQVSPAVFWRCSSSPVYVLLPPVLISNTPRNTARARSKNTSHTRNPLPLEVTRLCVLATWMRSPAQSEQDSMHLTSEMSKKVFDTNTDMAMISGGLTYVTGISTPKKIILIFLVDRASMYETNSLYNVFSLTPSAPGFHASSFRNPRNPMTSTPRDSSTLYPPNLVLGLTSRETADLTKKSHDVGRDVLGKPGITKGFFVESHDVVHAAASAGDIDGLSESDSDDESTSLSSIDEETLNRIPSPWLKRDHPDSLSMSTDSPPNKKRKMITDENSLRVPMMHGWRRETNMRFITQSGVRGEVVYFAPCGKAFRQYPDIMRYLEKNNINNVTRDHFSFSSKICVGDYIDATTNQRHSEGEVRSTILQIKEHRAKGAKEKSKEDIERSESERRDTLELEAEAILRRLEAEEAQDNTRKEYAAQFEQQNKLSWPGSGPLSAGQQDTREGILKEQERIKKQEELRKEKENMDKNPFQEDKQILFDELLKTAEREQEKAKQKIIKEQLYLSEFSKQRDMLYTLELERERRRYHGVLVRAIEARKKYEEKERKREELREEKRVTKERKNAERLQAKEMNQLMKEVKEDLELKDSQALPDIPLVQGLHLPPEAFGNVLMIFEFLHNFGETLGFDMESLPTLQSLQLSLLNDNESEEELLSVLSHLLVCAIEDPGIPAPQRHTTILGQTLNRADITHANISEILRVYLYANATGEVRVIHQLQGTEKERRENPRKGEEWDHHLETMEAYKMSQWLATLPFQALNATQKSEIVAYVCNELLQNKTVVHQIEESLERHNSLKTEKWKLDSRIRKLRMSIARKKIYSSAMRTLRDHSINDDSNLSASRNVTKIHGEHGEKIDKKEKPDDDKLKDEEEDDEEDDNMSGNECEGFNDIPDEEGDKNLNADEASKTLEILQRQMEQVRQDLFESCQQVRGFNCGQDRYQRTMWVLPHAGGPFLEGIDSCDYKGKDHFPLQVPPAQEKQGLTLDQVKEKLSENAEKKAAERKLKEEEQLKQELTNQVKEEKNDVKNDLKVEVKPEKDENQMLENGEKENRKPLEALNGQVKKEEKTDEEDEEDWEIPSIPVCAEGKTDEQSLLLKSFDSTTDNTSSLGISDGLMPLKANGSAAAGELGAAMSHLSNGIKEGQTVVPTPAQEGLDPTLIATGLGLVPGQYLRPEHLLQREKLVFSLVPRVQCSSDPVHGGSPTSHSASPTGTPRSSPRAASPFSPSTSHNLLPNKANSKYDNNATDHSQTSGSTDMEEQQHMLPPPPEFLKGWWHIENLDILREMINSYSDRGLRERELKRFIEKNYAIVKTALEKVDGEATHLEELSAEDEEVLYEVWGSVLADAAPHWSPEVALRMDLQVLDQVRAMEDKITSASMQNKTWRANAEGEEKPDGNWRASCLPPEDENDKRLNPVEYGRKRLLHLEEGIERRYLKPPLGITPNLKGEATFVDNGKDHPKGLLTWREAVASASTAAQLAMCTYMLETAVAWDKSIMKAYCQFCHSGDHEEKLLLCDGCDKGYHTHCFKPPMVNIPEGDWYCYECVNKFSGTSQRHCLVCGGTEGRTLIHCHHCPRAYHTTCIRPNLAKVPRNKWMCPACTKKSPRVRRGGRQKKVSESVPARSATPPAVPTTTPSAAESNPATPAPPTTPKKDKISKKEQRELSICRVILGELSASEDAWPFLLPVNTRQFPTYKKIIKKPMDLSAIRKKLEDNTYKSAEEFCVDLRLMFNNCETFNEDDSPVGKAGHNLRCFFQTKWNEHFPPT
ncbi:unnamed protein product, partial [Meganyctiphanes norvegica]